LKTFTAKHSFRLDINGLRAWAVVAVILYHFGLPGFGGGFSGVDVFFVISGFLMTGIVVAGLEQREQGNSNFSLSTFYLARARRILPALIALCAVLLPLGWLLLLPSEYVALARQAMFSLTFLSNIQYWNEAGYFDSASHEKWLLHTWSLSIEWQFYFLLPLVLLILWKWRPGRHSLTIFMAGGLAASLATSIALTPIDSSAAFYLLPSRAWEMLSGGMVYLLSPKLNLSSRQRIRLELAGFCLILLALLLSDASSPWPGWLAVLPVGGAVLVLIAARSASAWTGHPLAQWLGTRSYSLYLWHWPVVVTLFYLGRDRDPVAIGVGVLFTLVLGHLSYSLVETPALWKLGHLRLKAGAAVLLALAVVAAAPVALVQKEEALKERLSKSVSMALAEASNKNRRQQACFTTKGVESPSCMYGGDNLRAILIGDSHADAVTTALAAAVPKESGGVMAWNYISCPTLLGVKNLSPKYGPEEKCGEFLQWVVQKLVNVPKDVPLVIVNRSSVYAIGHNEFWENDANVPAVYFTQPHDTADRAFLKEFSQRLTDTACQLAQSHAVYLVRPIPEMGVDVPKAMSRALARGEHQDISISLTEYHQRHSIVWAAQDAAREACGVKILDPLPFLCHDGRCFGNKADRPLYYDDDHLSEFGNKLLVPMFAQIFETSKFEKLD
jgi:peptidoglycan/LPS O-acetylase OafA/YrhL